MGETSNVTERASRMPKVWEAALLIAIILALLIYSCLVLRLNARIPLLFATAITACFCVFIWKYKWEELETMMFAQIHEGMIALIINVLIGLLIASWIISGIVPYIIYLGLFIFTPRFFLLISLLLCCILSLCIGSSWTTAGTIGVALLGIGTTLGVHVGMIAGAVFAGAMFGDKQSPISESTNLCAIVAGTTLFDHVRSMWYTTVPALVITMIIYLVMGLTSDAVAVDSAAIIEVQNGLKESFWFNPVLLLPLVLFVIMIIKKMPAVLTMGLGIFMGIAIAFTQGFTYADICNHLVNGWSTADVGVESVNKILSRGGLTSMWGTISILLIGFCMGGMLVKCHVLSTLINHLKFIGKSTTSCIISTLVCEFTITSCIAFSYVPEMLTAAAFQPIYEKLDLNKKVLSRSLEDASTILNPIIPWTTTAVYYTGLFGIPATSYAGYYYFGYANSLIAILNAFTGWGTWYGDGTKRWGKSRRERESQKLAR